MKVGILGGTFDPIHSGHIRIALTAKEQFGLDKMWIMPARIPPHKQREFITDDVHRLMMIELSIPDESLEMNVMEFGREGKSYTSDTLSMLANEHPDGEWYYVMGQDSLKDFPKWHEPDTIASLAKIPVAVREEQESGFLQLLEERNRQYNGVFLPLSMKYQPVSSTMLRGMIHEGEDTELIAPRAMAYIRRFGLYGRKATAIREETFKQFGQFRELLEQKLSPHRLSHSIGVAHLAADFMQEYEERHGTEPSADGFYDSVQQTYIAGLLHDCAKYVGHENYATMCDSFGIPVTDEERSMQELLHAKVGCYLAEHEYGITDPVILSAIGKHCIGDENMSEIDLAVFTADFCEPFREHRPLGCSLHSIRMTGYENLTKAALMAIDCTVRYIRSMDWDLDSKTIDVRNSLNNKLRAECGERNE